MRTGEQLWNYGDWMMKAEVEKRRKQKRSAKTPAPTDIFKYDVKVKDEAFVGYNRNNGHVMFEAESYDEAKRVLEELYSA